MLSFDDFRRALINSLGEEFLTLRAEPHYPSRSRTPISGSLGYGTQIWDMFTRPMASDAISKHETAALALESKVLIELTGKDRHLVSAQQAQSWRASGYINVTPDADNLIVSAAEGFPAFVLGKVDVLDYLRSLPENTCNFTVTAFTASMPGNARYHELLAKELVRACAVGGAIFGANSDCLTEINRDLKQTDSWARSQGIVRLDDPLKFRSIADQMGFFVKSEPGSLHGQSFGKQPDPT